MTTNNHDEQYKSKIRKLRQIVLEQDSKIKQLEEDLEFMNTFVCCKCGHYTLRGYVCHVCGKDPTL